MIKEDILGNTHTEILHISPSGQKHDVERSHGDSRTHIKHVIFIPGNPGCLHFYTTWLPELHAMIESYFHVKTTSDTEEDTVVYVHGFSHPNHHFHDSSDDSYGCEDSKTKTFFEDSDYEKHTLPYQIEHAAAVIRSILQTHEDSQTSTHSHTIETNRSRQSISLVCHSLGAYVALLLLDDKNNQDIRLLTEHCILLMPFIGFKHIRILDKSISHTKLWAQISSMAISCCDSLCRFCSFSDQAIYLLLILTKS